MERWLDIVIVRLVLLAPLLGVGAGGADEGSRFVKGVGRDLFERLRQPELYNPCAGKSTGPDFLYAGTDGKVLWQRHARKCLIPDLLGALGQSDRSQGRGAEAERRERRNHQHCKYACNFHSASPLR